MEPPKSQSVTDHLLRVLTCFTSRICRPGSLGVSGKVRSFVLTQDEPQYGHAVRQLQVIIDEEGKTKDHRAARREDA